MIFIFVEINIKIFDIVTYLYQICKSGKYQNFWVSRTESKTGLKYLTIPIYVNKNTNFIVHNLNLYKFLLIDAFCRHRMFQELNPYWTILLDSILNILLLTALSSQTQLKLYFFFKIINIMI